MYIESYKILSSDTKLIDGIERDGYMTPQFLRLAKEYLESIVTEGKTALLYAAGPAMHHSDARDVGSTTMDGSIAVKSQIGYNVYNVARACKNAKIEYASSNANTCASSMYSLHEAGRLMGEGYTDVIVFASDLVEASEELLFEQLGVEISCGDGLAVVHLTKEVTERSVAEISKTAWIWNADRSPMAVSAEGYMKVLDELGVREVDVVKAHGTGTARNNEEELEAIRSSVECDRVVSYKHRVGHTQGVSALLELCMLIEDEDVEWQTGLVLASGLGGFYGGCVVRKV